MLARNPLLIGIGLAAYRLFTSSPSAPSPPPHVAASAPLAPPAASTSSPAASTSSPAASTSSPAAPPQAQAAPPQAQAAPPQAQVAPPQAQATRARGSVVQLAYRLREEYEEEAVEGGAVVRVVDDSELHVMLGDGVLRVVEAVDGQLSHNVVYDFAAAVMFADRWPVGVPAPEAGHVWRTDSLPPPAETLEVSLFAINALREMMFTVGVAQAKAWRADAPGLPSRFDIEVAHGVEDESAPDDEHTPEMRADLVDVDVPGTLSVAYTVRMPGADKWDHLTSAKMLPSDQAAALAPHLAPVQRSMFGKFLLYHTRLHPRVYHHLMSADTLPYHLDYTYRRGGKSVRATLSCTRIVVGGPAALVATRPSAFGHDDERPAAAAGRVLARDPELDALLHTVVDSESALLALSSRASVAATSAERAEALLAAAPSSAGGIGYVQTYLEYLATSLAIGADGELQARMRAVVEDATAAGAPAWTAFAAAFRRGPTDAERALATPAKLAVYERDVLGPAKSVRDGPGMADDSVTVSALAGKAAPSAAMISVMAGMAALQWSAYDVALLLLKEGLAVHPLLGAVYKDLGVVYWYRKEFWDAWSCFAVLRRILGPDSALAAEVAGIEAKIVSVVGRHYFDVTL